MKIKWIDLGTIKPDPDNPKDHDIEEIRASIRRFGFINPMIQNEATGRILAGHGRLEALLAMFHSCETRPDGIRGTRNEWLVPVLCGVSIEDEQEVQAYLVADNKLVEAGGWDSSKLASLLSGLGNLDGTGYTASQIAAIAPVLDRAPDEDEPVAPDLEPRNRRRIVIEYETLQEAMDVLDCFPCTSDAFKDTKVTYSYNLIMTQPEEDF